MTISKHTIMGLTTALLLAGPACTTSLDTDSAFRAGDGDNEGGGDEGDGDNNNNNNNDSSNDDEDGIDPTNGDAPPLDQGRPVGFGLSFPGELEAGQTIAVPLVVDPGGFAVGAYRLDLASDPSVHILSVEGTEDFPAPMAVNNRADEGRTTVVGISTTPGADGPVHVLDLTMTIIDPEGASGSLSLLSGSEAALYDPHGNAFMAAAPTLDIAG
ncbi:MAG: hypothetical protein K0V04_28140 [Deltaproteobacteria bacterium]|nr:hypothetical protein [Deltaproteobacteria bacterium]